MDSYDQPYLLSRPIEVVFDGWKSDTITLANNGWSIAAYIDAETRHHQFVFGHQYIKLIGISDPVVLEHRRLNYETHWLDPSIFIRTVLPYSRPMAIDVPINLNPNLGLCREVDCMPQVMEHQIKSIDDLCVFKWKDEQVVDNVLLEKADMSVIEHLESILLKQKDKQKELRQKVANNTLRQKDNVVQLIKVA